MTRITYAPGLIAGWLDSGLHLAAGQFTFSIPGIASTWPGYGASEEPGRPGYSVPDETMATAFIGAIGSWDELIAPDFHEMTDNMLSHGEIRLAVTDFDEEHLTAYAYFPSSVGGKPGDVWLNAAAITEDWGKGSFGYLTLVHELGHALGLEHSFISDSAPDTLDSVRYTVMSYNLIAEHHVTFSLVDGQFFADFSRPVPDTPMVLDIAAVQHMYGADPDTRSDDTIYVLEAMSPALRTIYDAGGTDTIDLTRIAFANIVDLQPGGYSSIGTATVAEQIVYWSERYPAYAPFVHYVFTNYMIGAGLSAYTFKDNVAIALSTIIENVLGSPADDEILGNDVNNDLNGNGGNDTLSGAGGDDTLNGGDGHSDIAVFFGNRSDYVAVVEGDGFRITDKREGSPDGSDRVVGVEIFRFADGDVQIPDLATNSPPDDQDNILSFPENNPTHADPGTNDPVSDAPVLDSSIADQPSEEDLTLSNQGPADASSGGNVLTDEAAVGGGSPSNTGLTLALATPLPSGTSPVSSNGVPGQDADPGNGASSVNGSFSLTAPLVIDAPVAAPPGIETNEEGPVMTDQGVAADVEATETTFPPLVLANIGSAALPINENGSSNSGPANDDLAASANPGQQFSYVAPGGEPADYAMLAIAIVPIVDQVTVANPSGFLTLG